MHIPLGHSGTGGAAAARRYAIPLAIGVGALPGWIAAVERLFFGHGYAAPALLHGIGDAAAILGLSLCASSLVLMLRVGWLERHFGGLDRLYRAHHLTGTLAFLALLFHPVAVGLRLLLRHGPDSALAGTLPSPMHFPEFLGWVALSWLMATMVATFVSRLSYHAWKWLHASAAIAFLLSAGHLLLVRRTADWALWPLALWIVAGIAAVIWRMLVDRGNVSGRRYLVERVAYPGDGVADIALRPLDQPPAIAPGQFVFAAFYDGAGYRGCGEYHPFTVASTGGDASLRLIVKALGDCTDRMQHLRPGVPARIQGPFGAFRPASDDRPQIWIAGGIGITPFIAMAAGLGDDGPLVRLYYGVPARSDASFLEELERIAARRPRLELRPLFADRGEIPNIASIEAESGPLAGKEFLICGPVAMVAALSRDLEGRGVPASAIHAERFDFR